MLYLIRTFGRGKDKTALKVGYSGDLDSRLKSYYHQNPFFEPISCREGELYEEELIHLYLRSLGLKLSFLNEWFLDSPETLTEFHASKLKMQAWVWRYRDELFSVKDFKKGGNNIRRRIYEDLRMTMYEPGKEKEIDIEWRKEAGKKVLKDMRSKFYGG